MRNPFIKEQKDGIHVQKVMVTMKRMQTILLCFFLLVSCGKGYRTEDSTYPEIVSGQFGATLKPLNPKLGIYTGWVTLSISDNQLWARVKLNGKRTKKMHAQYLHLNSKCPDMNHDLNHDGYIDFVEATTVSGPIIIPLDSNLNGQMKGLNEFPKMKATNSFYYYSEACNVDNMLADLTQKDESSGDGMIKLLATEKVSFDQRVVMIYGTSEETPLPQSVRSFEGYPSHDSIPIACGQIKEGYIDPAILY